MRYLQVLKFRANDVFFISVLQTFRLTEDPPTKVLEVRSDSYVSRPIQYREESILLYGPKLPADGKSTNKEKCFEIVLHKPFTESLHQMYR